jgi:hypothetical protein
MPLSVVEHFAEETGLVVLLTLKAKKCASWAQGTNSIHNRMTVDFVLEDIN